jgi:dTMP kinase
LKGTFVVLEGIDGCGKTTQAQSLFAHYSNLGRDVLSLKEPGGTPTGEKIRELFLDDEYSMSAVTELLLIEASRYELVNRVIVEALADGKLIVCQRYVYSSLAYQGYGRGLDLDWIESLNYQATGGLLPDIAFFLDVPVDVGLERLRSSRSPDRMELEGAEFLQKVYAGYREIEKSTSEFERIDGTLSEDKTLATIIEKVDGLEGGQNGH